MNKALCLSIGFLQDDFSQRNWHTIDSGGSIFELRSTLMNFMYLKCWCPLPTDSHRKRISRCQMSLTWNDFASITDHERRTREGNVLTFSVCLSTGGGAVDWSTFDLLPLDHELLVCPPDRELLTPPSPPLPSAMNCFPTPPSLSLWRTADSHPVHELLTPPHPQNKNCWPAPLLTMQERRTVDP